MNIFFIINTIEPGGAEVFLQRFTERCIKNGDSVYVMPMDDSKTNHSFEKLFVDAGVNIVERYKAPNSSKEWLFWKINAVMSLFGKKGVYLTLKLADEKQYYKKFLKNNKIDVINSHLPEADNFALSYLKHNFSIPVAITLHGCFNKVHYEESEDKEAFVDRAYSNFSKADTVIHVSKENILIASEFKKECFTPFEKIYLGYEKKEIQKDAIPEKLDLNKTIFGMVGRGIKEKGWEIAINAFIKANNNNAQLVLVSPLTDYMLELKEKYANYSNIIFTGYQIQPEQYIYNFDVALLPSGYKSESLPVSIIEELSFGVPVVATNVGDIKEMIQDENLNYAGKILKYSYSDEQIVSELAEVISTYISNKELLKEHSEIALKAAEKFDMGVCYENHLKIFKTIAKQN